MAGEGDEFLRVLAANLDTPVLLPVPAAELGWQKMA